MTQPLQNTASHYPVPAENVMPDIDKQISTAKHYPRDVKQFFEEARSIINLSAAIAKSCYYIVPREDKKTGKIKNIEGPSVRLAEIAVSCWKNIYVATQIRDSKDGKTVRSEGAAWDLENNVRVTQEVERLIVNRDGGLFSLDMQQTTQKAASAIAYRNVVFKVIPRCFVEGLYQEAKERVQQEVDKADPSVRQSQLQRAIEKLQTLGVTESNLLKIVRRPSLDAITVADFSTLVGIGTAINQGIFQPLKTSRETEPTQAVATLSDEKYEHVKTLAEEHKTNVALLCEAMGVTSLHELTDSQADECIELIKEKQV